MRKMDSESSFGTPTAVFKICGEFDSRVRTASRSMSSTGMSSFLKSTSRPAGSKRLHMASLNDDGDAFELYPKARRTEESVSLQAEVDQLKMKLIQKESDCLALETQVGQAEAVNKKYHLEMARHRLEWETERAGLVRESRADKGRMRILEERLEKVATRLAHNKEYASLERRSPTSSSTTNLRDDINTSLSSIDDRRELLAEIQDLKGREMSLKRELAEVKDQKAELKETCALLEKRSSVASKAGAELEQVKAELNSAQSEVDRLTNLEKARADLKVHERAMSSKIERQADMKRKINHLKQENQLLNQTAENAQLAREKITYLTEQLAAAEKRLAAVAPARDDLKMAQRKLQEWSNLCWKLLSVEEKERYGTAASVSVDVMSTKVADLQHEIISRTSDIEEVRSVVEAKNSQLKEAETKLAEAESKSQADKNSFTEQTNLIKRFKRKLLLVSKERDSYKGILDSYEHEITFNGASFERERVAALEQSLKDYRDTVERLEELLSQARSATTAPAAEQPPAPAFPQPSTSKIIHFLDNPLSQAVDARKSEAEDLRNEITALKARIKLLEEGETNNLTLLVGRKVDEDGSSSEEVKELRDQLQSCEVKKQRIIEAFKKTSQEFREVCYLLTGYRIDSLNDGKYRLSPVYAESSDDHLLFKRDRESGECMLLESQFSSQLGDFIDLHLSQQNSIPVFLAAVITDLFSRSTFCDQEDDDDDEEEVRRRDDEGEVESQGEYAEDGDDDDQRYASEEEEEVEEEEEIEEPASDSSDIVCID